MVFSRDHKRNIPGPLWLYINDFLGRKKLVPQKPITDHSVEQVNFVQDIVSNSGGMIPPDIPYLPRDCRYNYEEFNCGWQCCTERVFRRPLFPWENNTMQAQAEFQHRVREHIQAHIGPLKHCHWSGCRKSFSGKRVLERHIFSVHLGTAHICQGCGAIFNRRSALKRHGHGN